MRGDLRGDSRGVNTARASAHDNRFASEFEAAKGFGWTVGENHFDWGLLKVNRHAEVGRLEAIYRRNLNNAGVVIHQGHARMIDQSTVAIDNATTLQGKTILIATGAQAVNDLSVQGYELCIDSNAFFEMERQ
ncbi:MAG: glutathione-disulfide reductase, partial [Betaproteobacteria bacterium]|nr:glutathione-disulfide reductase [Betaproteobacteria bacterium]